MHLTYRWRATLVIAMASFTVLVYSITQAGTDGWGTPAVIGSLIAGCVLLVAFVLVELLVTDPVMDLRLFCSYTFTIANVLAWVSSAVFFASLFLVPVFFERMENLSALTTGIWNLRRLPPSRMHPIRKTPLSM